MKLPSIKDPFVMEPNATVYFEVPTGQFRIEAKTRNKIPTYTEVSTKAWITELGDPARIKQQEDAATDQTADNAHQHGSNRTTGITSGHQCLG